MILKVKFDVSSNILGHEKKFNSAIYKNICINGKFVYYQMLVMTNVRTGIPTMPK